MPSLTQLPNDQLQVALGAADALMEHKAFLPGGLLFMLIGKFRDDTREALDMNTAELPQRGKERRTLDELTSLELDRVSGAVAVLLQPRFSSAMDDPALPRLLFGLADSLRDQKTERAEIRESMVS